MAPSRPIPGTTTTTPPTDTGAKTTHTFTGGGQHTVSLTVTDNGGATNTVTKTVSTNAPPTAAFTSSCTNLSCTFDASTSSDSDGTVASYAWAFGDGMSGTGVAPSRTYAKAGTYTVTLTVEDNGGATSSPVSHPVTVSAETAQVWASDGYNRTRKSGWGSAGIGGAWSDSGCRSMSVSSGYGTLVDTRGTTCSVWLAGVKRANTDTSVTMRAPSVPAGGMQVDVVGRRISAADDISVQLGLKHNGDIVATLLRHVGSEATALSKSVTVSPAAGSNGQIHVELRVFGASPTQVRAKVWPNGKSEPSTWTLSAKTTTAALQHQGSIGIATYLYKTNNPETAALRVSSVVSRAVVT